MDWFESKRALLEYLGKNTDDRKLIKRMIERWEVYEEWGMFYLSEKAESVVEKKEEKSESKEMVDKQTMDDKELKELKDKNDKLMRAYKKERDRNEVYMWMYDHLVFFYEKFQRYHKFVEWKVFWQTAYNNNEYKRQETMDMNRQTVYDRYDFSYWEDEKAECEAVDRIISQRNEELSELPF